MKPTVAFIGLGNMGRHMATNLVKNGYTVRGFDMVRDAMASVPGLAACESPRDAAEKAQVVVTSLPNNQIVRAALSHPETGVFAASSKLRLIIDSSTISPSLARELASETARRYQESSGALLDAPVSGGVNGAKAGTLTFMVGADHDKDFEYAQPLLAGMGKNIVRCGSVGTGQVAKICNNLVLAISMIGVSEAMNLGIKMGMDKKVLAGIMNTSTARCWSSDTYNPVPGVLPNVPSANKYEGGFGSALMLKDLGLALDAGKESSSPLPLGNASQALYSIMCENGLAKKDFGAVFEFLGGLKEAKKP